jgi:ligand-binding sensor domain-containing protein
VTEFSGATVARHLADGIFAQALAERNGTLWIGTVDQGMVSLPLATHAPRPQLTGRETETPSIAGFADISGALAAITSHELLDTQTDRAFIQVTEAALASGHISALHEDALGKLWIGYFDRGLDVLTPVTSMSPRHVENDVLFCINRIRENPHDGTIAVATANGLALFDAGGTMREVLDAKSGLIASHVTDVLFRRDGENSRSMVIATPAGLTFLNGGSLRSLYAFHGLVNNHVYTIAETGGTLYAGTLGGVSTLRNALVEASFTTANSRLQQNWITASAVFDGQLYLGTYGSGVVRFDDHGTVTPFRAFGGRRVEINANAMVASGRALYAGTAQYGLAILRHGDERWQFVTEGLPSGNVTALDEHGGHLYIGTDNGLVTISENNLIP